MHYIESGHRAAHARRSGRDRGQFQMDSSVDGVVVDSKRSEPELIRQKPLRSVRDAKLAAADKPLIVKVKCRRVIRGGHAQEVPLTQAKGKFQSHQLKCQSCQHRMQCATA